MEHQASSNCPNRLIIMSDEHGPMFSGTDGHPLVKTPSMDRLADEGATFDAAYCNAPLCIPSRLSFMTGRFVSRCKGWDNATPLASDAMTWPYALRSVGYDVALAGKMHLIGPDTLHGYTEDQVRRARAAYYGLVTYLDDKIGRLLDALEGHGLADNTVVVHTSDHGESLGEHGLWP